MPSNPAFTPQAQVTFGRGLYSVSEQQQLAKTASIFMNEYEINDAHAFLSDDPILGPAVDTLYNLKDWTNQNSDGWAYWPKPSKASARLQQLIHDAYNEVRFGDEHSVTAAQVRSAMGPIKSFFTRQNVDASGIIVTAEFTRKSIPTQLRDAGHTVESHSGDDGRIVYVINGEEMRLDDAADRYLEGGWSGNFGGPGKTSAEQPQHCPKCGDAMAYGPNDQRIHESSGTRNCPRTTGKTADVINYGGGPGSDDPGIDFETHDPGHKAVYNGMGTDGKCEVCGGTVLFNGFGGYTGLPYPDEKETLWVHVNPHKTASDTFAYDGDAVERGYRDAINDEEAQDPDDHNYMDGYEDGLNNSDSEKEEKRGPQEEDIVVSNGNVSIVNGPFIGTFSEEDEADEAIKAYMQKHQFWPNVWNISDHGNASFRTLSSKTAFKPTHTYNPIGWDSFFPSSGNSLEGGEDVEVVGPVGDPANKFVYVRTSDGGEQISVDRKSLDRKKGAVSKTAAVDDFTLRHLQEFVDHVCFDDERDGFMTFALQELAIDPEYAEMYGWRSMLDRYRLLGYETSNPTPTEMDLQTNASKTASESWDTGEVELWFNNDEGMYHWYRDFEGNLTSRDVHDFWIEVKPNDSVDPSVVDWSAVAEYLNDDYKESEEE